MGKFKTVDTYFGESYSYCEEYIYTDLSECYEKCEIYWEECSECWIQRDECCEDKFVNANKENCLKYKSCNNANYDWNGEICDDDEPWCGECDGNRCWPVSEKGRCYTYDHNTGSSALTNVNTAEECFSIPNCGWKHYRDPDYPDPVENWESLHCQRGCYIAAANDSSDCPDNFWYNHDLLLGNGGCFRDYYNGFDVEDCKLIEGALSQDNSATFDPPRFNSSEMCSIGQCEGSWGYDHWNGWSKEDCLERSVGSCSESCEYCESNSGYSGMCFSNAAEPDYFCYSPPCALREYTNETSCLEINEAINGNATWVTCNNRCGNNGDDNTWEYQSELQCHTRWERCKNPDDCSAIGWCSDWENVRYTCEDLNWVHGDTCWKYISKDVVDANGVTRTEYSYEHCNHCVELPGVCVQSLLEGETCEDGFWHSDGCRVSGVSDSNACEDLGYEWKSRATTKEECESSKYCYEDYRGHTNLSPDECTKCGGTLHPRYEWYGGKWKSPYMKEFKWMNSTEEVSSNIWSASVVEHLLRNELMYPM